MRVVYAMETCKSGGPELRLSWCGVSQAVDTMCMPAAFMFGASIRYAAAELSCADALVSA